MDMSDSTIDGLRAALEHSPDNQVLRVLLADTLLGLNRLEEAEEEYSKVLSYGDNRKAKLGLAKLFFSKGNYSACIVILEDITGGGTDNIEELTLFAKALKRENSLADSVVIYKKIKKLDPDFIDEELDGALTVKQTAEDLDFLDELDPRFLERPSTTFSDVGGMDGVKKEIELKILKPTLHPELYKAYGKKVGGGILLYGPPGCGKTFIARATAGEVKAKFITIGLSDILDMYIGNSEKNLHEIFELARENTPCVLFIDEIDALGASRADMKQSAGRHVINQFLQELDGIDHNNEGVLVLGATNTPWNLDAAFRRPGRFDRIIFVPPPDLESRSAILRLKMQRKPSKDIDFDKVAKKSSEFSGADIDAVIDLAVESKLEASFTTGVPEPIETSDLLAAVKRHKASTLEWFKTAKNYATFANDSGLYDDILMYLKVNK